MCKKIDIQEWFFGVEFECAMPQETVPRIGSYTIGVQIPSLPVGWKAKSDGSITGFPRAWKGIEIVSPKLHGVQGLRDVKSVLSWALSNGANINVSCGMHIHLDWPLTMDHLDLKRVVYRVANSEKALYATTGTKKREKHFFSQPMKELYRDLQFRPNQLPLPSNIEDSSTLHTNWRRRLLNMTNLNNPGKRTLEFRYAAGTLRYIKVQMHICMVMGLMQKALATHLARYDSLGGKTYSRDDKRGPGEAEVARVLYSLGWIKGRSQRVYGDVMNGASDLPTVKEMRKEAVRLANKYDAEVSSYYDT